MPIVIACLIVCTALLALLIYVQRRLRREQTCNLRNSRILSSIGDGLIVVDSEQNLVFVNEAGQQLLDSAADVLENMSPRWEYFHRGLKKWYEMQRYPDGTGGNTIVVRDVTANREKQEALQASEESLASALRERKRTERASRCLAESSRILEASLEYEPTFEELTEYLTREFCDACIAVVPEEFHIQRLSAADPGIALGGAVYADAIVNVLAIGLTELQRTAHGVCAFVPISTGSKVAGVLLLITARAEGFDADDVLLFEEIARRAGLALEHAQLYRTTQEVNRLKDEFVAIVSHELRTPLTPILGAVYMLRSESTNPHVFERAMSLIERNAKAQAKIVEDLFDISRIISGKLQMNLDRVDLPAIIRQAVETINASSEAKNISLSVSVRPLRNVVYGDSDRLQQVVWNLLSNSVKFTPPGGKILIELFESPTHAELRVVDTGIGIDAEFLPHVFDRFRQADSSRTRPHGGLGLGLAIVRYLVESHGGTVHAASNGEKQGSTFTVKLPVRPVVQQTAYAG